MPHPKLSANLGYAQHQLPDDISVILFNLECFHKTIAIYIHKIITVMTIENWSQQFLLFAVIGDLIIAAFNYQMMIPSK